MPVLAAVDVGSNAIRMALGRVNGRRRIDILDNVREPIRLGHDVFAGGAIAEATTERAMEAFRRFRERMRRSGVKHCRAVGTSALREAQNRELFIGRVEEASGIGISVVPPEEEARLIHLGVSGAVRLRRKLGLLIDIGGGSVEITLSSGGRIAATGCYRMGAVRLLQELGARKRGERHFQRLVGEYVEAARVRLRREIGRRRVDVCVGTGGNIEALADLRRAVFGRPRNALTLRELDALADLLKPLAVEDRIRRLGLRPDRADVIVPAALVLQRVLRLARVARLVVPRVGLKEGLLRDLAREIYEDKPALSRDQILDSALQLGRKCAFDEKHGRATARFAVRLFRETRDLHRLDAEHEMLLEVAALLHDIGHFVSGTGHHKHTAYLLASAPLVGLSDAQRAIVANTARYHRKSFPSLHHEPYRALSAKDRVTVSRLAALLRLADALDTEHAGRVTDLRVERRMPLFRLRLRGRGDLLLEKWAIARKSDLFEEVFGLKVVVT